MDQMALAECTSEELAAAVGQVHALENAVRSSLLELIGAGDERKLWAEDGCQSIENWLAMCLGIAWRTAAELVRVTRSFSELPAVSSVFSSGALSWDKARALARVATADSDAEWAEEAPSLSVSFLEREARRARERSEAEAAQARQGHGLVFRKDRERPVTRMAGLAPDDKTEVIRSAIEAEADKIGPNPETGELDSYASRRMDALYKICSEALGADGAVDRATVVLHQDPDGSMRFADGAAMATSVAEYLGCDCREQHPDGSVRSVISAALRRQVL